MVVVGSTTDCQDMALSLSFYESVDSSEYALMHCKVFLLFDMNNKQCIVDTIKLNPTISGIYNTETLLMECITVWSSD